MKINSFNVLIYQILCVLCLFAHIHNSVQIGPLKLFHIFVALAFVYSFIINTRTKNTYSKLAPYMIAFFSFIFGVISFASGAFRNCIDVLLIIVSLRKISYLELDSFMKLSVAFSTLTIVDHFALYYLSLPIWRFQGFYQDPNYFVLSFTLLAYINIISIFRSNSKFFNTIALLNLLGILILTAFSLSRTGLLCLLLLYVISFRTYLSKHKVIGIIVVFFTCLLCYQYGKSILGNQLENLVSRVDGSRKDGIASAANLRFIISYHCLSEFVMLPQYWLQGIGTGATNSIDIPNFTPPLTGHRDHNTISSIFVENGVIVFIIYIVYLLSILKRLVISKRMKAFNKCEVLITKVFFLVLMIFSLSVYCYSYLPFWLSLFIMDNKYLFYNSPINLSDNITCLNESSPRAI